MLKLDIPVFCVIVKALWELQDHLNIEYFCLKVFFFKRVSIINVYNGWF